MAQIQQARYKAENEGEEQRQLEAAHRERELQRKIEAFGKSFQQVLVTKKPASPQNYTDQINTVRHMQTKHMLHEQHISAQRNTFEEGSPKAQVQNDKALPNTSTNVITPEKAVKLSEITARVNQQHMQQQQHMQELPFSARIFIAPNPAEIRSNHPKTQTDPRFLMGVGKNHAQPNSTKDMEPSIKGEKAGSNSSQQSYNFDESVDAVEIQSPKSDGPASGHISHSHHINKEKVMILQMAFDAFKKQLNMKYPSLRVPAVHPELGGFEINMRYDRNTGMVKHVQFKCQNANMTSLLANNRQGFERILANYRMTTDPDAFSFITHDKLQQI